MNGVVRPALFVNLCSGTNNVRIRQNLVSYDSAYLDSCASTTEDPAEYRFSRLMPYTYTEIKSRFPHWLCWGINPGLVEIITRRILSELPDRRGSCDIAVYEFDQLKYLDEAAGTAVGWCPEALVEEIMLSPTLEIQNGRNQETSGSGTIECRVNWGKKTVSARIVGHEDIWNLGVIPAAKNVRFYYSLQPEVMQILSLPDAAEALSMLTIPGDGDSITGLEQVAVQVDSELLEQPRTLVWSEDHGKIWERFGVNAVQYQTAKSLLLAVMLLQRTEYGCSPCTYNASSLPISAEDWPVIDSFMAELDINWQDGTHLKLHALDNF